MIATAPAVRRFYVGNIKYGSRDEDLVQFFSPRRVVAVRFILDRETGEQRGFAFVDVECASADEVVREYSGKKFAGRSLKVSEAIPKQKKVRE